MMKRVFVFAFFLIVCASFCGADVNEHDDAKDSVFVDGEGRGIVNNEAESSQKVNMRVYTEEDLMEPFQIIVPDEETHTKLVLLEEGLEKLRSIKADEVSVLGVVGSYHSGKSFLMNQLVSVPAGTRGFVVGPSVNPQTHGIWAWVTKVPNSDKTLLIIDTEGFHAMEANDLYDSKIFAVALLISSSLIYNTNKIIDQKQIDYLELIAGKTEMFALKQELQKGVAMNGVPRITSFPPLHWIVRDFSQQLDVTPTEWLHSVLKKFQVDENGSSQNVTHETLLSLFESTDCHTLWFPSDKHNVVQDLNMVGTDSSSDLLNSKWKEDIARLREDIFSEIKPKTIRGSDDKMHSVSGPGIASMLDVLVKAANTEKMLLNIQSSFGAFVDKAGSEAVKEASKSLEAIMLSKMEKPLTRDVFDRELKQAQARSRDLLKQIVFNIEYLYRPFVKPLEQEINLVSSRMASENLNKIRSLCSAEADAAEEKLESSLSKYVLPLSRSTLSSLITSELRRSLGSFSQAMLPFETVPQFEYKKEYAKLEKHLEGTSAKYREKNVELIKNVVGEAHNESIRVFSEMKSFAVLKNDEELEQKKKELYSAAMKSFNEATMVISSEKEVSDAGKELRGELLELFQQCYKENRESIKKYAEGVIKSALTIHQSVLNELNLPDEESALKRAFAQGEAAAMEHLDTTMAKFSGSPVFAEIRKDLHSVILRANDATTKLNIEALKNKLFQPKDDAFKRLKEEVNDYWFLFSFKNHARDVFDKAIGDLVRNPSFKESIIEDFTNEVAELYGSGLVTLRRVGAYACLLIVACVVIGVIILIMKKRRAQP